MPRKPISLPDIQFVEGDSPRVMNEKLNRVTQLIRMMAAEHQRFAQMLDEGTSGQVLTKNSSADFDASWQDP